jgi:hypothetical protein
VIGFQFKIGPEVAYRWGFMWDPIRHQIVKVKTRNMYNGDVNLLLPRAEPGSKDRGVYGLNLSWRISEDPRDHRHEEQAGLFKEIPHGTYSGEFGFDGEFNVENPNPHIGDIKDGRWHGMLGAIWNGREYWNGVTMSLWYNPSDSHNFNDFIFLGKGVDSPYLGRPIPPRGPLTLGLNEVDKSPSGGLWGNELFVAEHDLGIRIDEIASEYVEVRNMYAANVFYVGPEEPTIMTTVPYVLQEHQTQASQDVIAAHLVPNFTGPNNTHSWVSTQSPGAGQSAPQGSTVLMTLRDDPQP